MIKQTITNNLKLVTVLIGILILISCNDQSAKDSLATAKEKGYLNYEVLNDSVVYHYIYRSGINWYKGEAASFTVKNAYPKTFKELAHHYAKDSFHIFHKGHKLKKRDVASFEVISKIITKDKFGVYLENKKITHSDGLSFKFINDNYAIDKNQVYHFSLNDYAILKNADKKTFKAINNNYAKDKNYAYYLDYNISTNPNSFIILRKDYAKDDKNIFYKNKIVQADYTTFRVLDSVLKKGTHFIDAEDNIYYYSKEKAIKK